MADDNLKSMLNQAMRSPRHFALAAKGSEVALYVSKKPVQGTMLKELKARVGATKSYEGVCRSGEAGLTFQSLDAMAQCHDGRQQPQAVQCRETRRLQQQPGAHRPNVTDALVDRDLVAGTGQRRGDRETRDTGADDCDVQPLQHGAFGIDRRCGDCGDV